MLIVTQSIRMAWMLISVQAGIGFLKEEQTKFVCWNIIGSTVRLCAAFTSSRASRGLFCEYARSRKLGRVGSSRKSRHWHEAFSLDFQKDLFDAVAMGGNRCGHGRQQFVHRAPVIVELDRRTHQRRLDPDDVGGS
jgi:hypothetical protein